MSTNLNNLYLFIFWLISERTSLLRETISNTKQAFMNEICIVWQQMVPPLVDSKILFSLIFSLNVHVSIFFFFTTMDYINTVHIKHSCLL